MGIRQPPRSQRTTIPNAVVEVEAPRRARSAPFRLAVLTSHPIQYQAPLLRLLAQTSEIDLTVFFCARVGAETYLDPGFGVPVQWNTPILDGYRHVFLPNIAIRPSVNRFFGLVNPSIVAHLARGHWDALLVHGYAHATNWLAFAAARPRGIPVLLRGELSPMRPTSGVRRAVRSVVLRQLFRRVSAFLTIGTYNAESYRSLGVPPEKMFHTPYAVDNEGFIAQADALRPVRDEIRRRLGVPPDRVLLLFCGKFIPRKRPLDLLAALARPGLERAVAGFVGDGELRPAMERQGQHLGPERVRIFGFKDQRELAEYYTAADAFVLPARFESWGLVVNEAMCFGLPVVTTTGVSAARDLVADGWNGYVHEPGDVDALAHALQHFVRSDELRDEMGRRSRARISGWSNAACVEGITAALAAVSRVPAHRSRSTRAGAPSEMTER